MMGLVSLFFFTMASAGFILFMAKYPRRSEVRIWGIRFCYLLGFLGVLAKRLYAGQFTEISLLIVASLIVSMLAFELSSRYLD